MKDVVYTGQVLEITSLMGRIGWNKGALMILERVPMGWLNEEECERVIRFEIFDSEEDFDSCQEGRVFDSDKELVWSWGDEEGFRVVCTGADTALSELEKEEADWSHSVKSYALWGRQSEAEPSVFLELQIPRILCYPVSFKGNRSRPALKVIEYRDKINGEIQHCRFQSLEEWK